MPYKDMYQSGVKFGSTKPGSVTLKTVGSSPLGKGKPDGYNDNYQGPSIFFPGPGRGSGRKRSRTK